MRRRSTRAITAYRVLGFGMFAALARGAEPPSAVTVRLVRPDSQCERLLALFQGARAPHPAAALAAWKRATTPLGDLGKPLEAAIAAFNPEMSGELRVLDQAELVLAFDPDDGALRWHANVPRDDGTFAALATALTLTDGGSDPPLGTVAVDRLGPPGAPLMARASAGIALGGSRESLGAALGLDPQHAGAAQVGRDAIESGWLVRVEPEHLGRSGPIERRRLAEALRGPGASSIDASACLDGETFAMTVTTRLDDPPRTVATIDPTWLDGLPATDLLAVFAWVIDPRAEAWDRAFAVADRIERADPAHADVAPLRTRINLVAATVKVHPEVDLWPRLRGLSGALLADRVGHGHVAGAIVALHTDGPESAEQIAMQVLPRLARLIGGPPEPAASPDGTRLLGKVRDRPLFVNRKDSTVRLVWGESALGQMRIAGTDPGRSIGPVLRKLAPWGEALPRRFVAFWPGRLGREATVGEPLARSLREAPPVLWSGHDVATGASDVVRWTGLRGLVHRFLDNLPLDPPPDH